MEREIETKAVQMKFKITPDKSVDVEIKRITKELIDDAMNQIARENVGPHEAIHEVRKDCKKIRGVIRIVRPQFPSTYRKENKSFRDAAADLSDLRDAEAVIECYDALLQHFEDEVDRAELAPIRRRLTAHKKEAEAAVTDLDERLETFREGMREARARVDDWKLPEKGFDALGPGLLKTYQRGRRAMEDAFKEPSVEAFHEWRKRTKYLRYHSRLLQDTWKPVVKKFRQEVKDLSDYLGDDHDLAVLRDVLLNDLAGVPNERRLQTLLGLMDRRSAELREKSRLLGERIYAEKPKAFLKRMRSYYKTASEEMRAQPKLSQAPAVVTT